MRSASHRRPGGFTLIEVCLAIVVVAIGIMAAFALIGTGMDSSQRAVADTRASMFADDVINTLRSQSTLAYDTGGGAWERFWKQFRDGDAAIYAAAGPMWQYEVITDVTNYVQIYNGGPHALSFTNYSFRTEEQTEIVNHALRYTMNVQIHTEPLFPAGVWTNRATVVLNVWEGQFGVLDLDRALTFVSTFENSGGL